MDSSAEFGRYRILGEIGRGAWGTVYRALDTLIGREVAIKSFRLAPAGAGEAPAPGAPGARETLREELLREARSAGMLSHPHVVTLYDVVESADGSFFIAMEYVQGRSLAEILEGAGPPDFETTVDWVSQIASALDYLHAMGLVHRDVKPANVLITDGGRVKLTDFGIAAPGPGAGSGGVPGALPGGVPGGGPGDARADGGAVLGTPGYMAPEQILGREITPRADVWSLGVILYEMLVGRRPFEGRTVAEVVHRVVHQPVPPLDEDRGLPAPIGPLLDRAMAKDPRWRFASAGDLARELRQILYHAAAEAGEELSEEDMLERTLVTAPHLEGELAGELAGKGAGDRFRSPARTSAAAAAPAQAPGDLAGGRGARHRLSGRGVHRRLSGRAAAVAAALLGVALAAVVYLAQRSLTVEPVTAAEVATLQAGLDGPSLEALRILHEGQRLLAAGDAEGAALFFEVVERLEPRLAEPERIARLRRQAEAEARRRGAELEVARSALGDRPARDLVASARQRMPADDGDARKARAALDRAGEALADAGTAAGDPSAAATEARVRVEFTSDSPEGAVTLYAGGEQLLRRGFSYYERAWWLGRTPSTGGFEQELAVPPGADSLWVYVARAGSPAQRLEVPGRFRKGSRTTLTIHLPAEGEATAELATPGGM